MLRRTLAQSYRLDSAEFLRQYCFIAQFSSVKTPSVGMVLALCNSLPSDILPLPKRFQRNQMRSPDVGW